MTEISKPGRRKLIFDGDGSQFLDTGIPCSVCGKRQEVGDSPASVFIRVREKLDDGSTRLLMLVCPDCVARMFLQVTRLDLWKQVSGTVLAAIRRLLAKKFASVSVAQPPHATHHKALGSIPEKQFASRALQKLLPAPKGKK